MTAAALLAAVTIAFPKEGQLLPSVSRCYAIGATDGGETSLVVRAGRRIPVSRTGAWGTLVEVVPGTNVLEIGDCRRTFVVAKADKGQTAGDKGRVYAKLPYAADEPAQHAAWRKPSEALVVIDAGHGGADTGAVSPHGLPEKDANLRLAKAVAAKLKASGVHVLMTREGDETLELYSRPKSAHALKADAFVSIHHNAPGYETDPTDCRYQAVYAWNPIGEKLAQSIVGRMAAARPDLPSKGVIHANFAVTRSPEIPSCLVEADFITHPDGETDSWSADVREPLAAAIADGILASLSVPCGPTPNEKDESLRAKSAAVAGTPVGFAAEAAGIFAVGAELPAGNVVVTKIADGTVHLRPDQRDTDGYWFYWKFRVTGAAGRTLSFRFPHPVVGSRGPAVSTDRGKTWAWGDDLQSAPLDPQTKDHADAQGFDWTFGEADDEVWFCQTLPYDPSDWRAFLDRHAADCGRLFEEGVLCTSRKGNPVPYARFGRLDGKAKERIFLSSRHHCGEVTATIVLEGFLEQVFADDELGRWLREDVELRVVPFADYEGVLAGDQGKNRKPHDYARDYNDDRPVLYPEVRAVMDMLRDWKPTVVTDIHCPWLRGSWFRENDSNEFIYQVGIDDPATTANQGRLAAILERTQRAGLDYRAADDYWFGRGWNSGANYAKGRTLIQWSVGALSGLKLATSWEIPFANARFRTLCPADFRAFGRDMADAYWVYLCGACVDGIYPHLAMTNDEGECGTGAVVPWAGSLWAVTYGPHCPVGSSDKLYQVTPDMRQVVRAESVGGTHADRMIHRETNQLLIGPYVIDAKGGVRVVPTAAMPGRLTGVARHLRDPAEKVYVATMETGLYELDLRTLAVNTLIRENGKNDWPISNLLDHVGADWPAGWRTAPQTRVPGYHAKGLCTGFGRVFVANNGEDSEEARRNPFVPSGVLAWWNEAGRDWTTIRRCQFTEIATRDGIYGNEHPETNPVWSLGWDAKSVILAVTTNGTAWTHYRLPKASHCYDGAHGWNTEWPRIRDVGFGDGTLLATMHGTFWKFPKDFSPARPDGIRPLSTYLKVIGDFCRWRDRLVFGCDDQAKNEFLGTRTLKKGAPKRDRSQSNLWFVKPEDLTTFGPPSGEGWVWFDEDVKEGDVSDPFLWAGYEDRRFSFSDAAGASVPHELLHEGDWVRVRALADAKGARAHFRYGPKRPATLPSYDGFVEVYDDHSKRTYRFPNVNGDKTVICREVATERDLLYAGGVFYEVPADNAGGFAVLRPIALASEPVRSIEARLGLVFINGKPQALDSLWKNGTAAAAYWLWEECRVRCFIYERLLGE